MNILILDRDTNRRKALFGQIAALLPDAVFAAMEQRDVFERPPDHAPDAAFVWIGGMPDLEAARQLIRVLPRLSVVLVSDSGEYAIESYEIGADYYLIYPTYNGTLAEALERCGVRCMLENRRNVTNTSAAGQERKAAHD